MIVIIIFMAVTSAGSAELVAVSSLVSYDVYKTYINPKATGKQVNPTCTFTLVSLALTFLALLIFKFLSEDFRVHGIYKVRSRGNSKVSRLIEYFYSKKQIAGGLLWRFGEDLGLSSG